jgi:polyisoprenoid-binding protein YceI
MKTSRSVTIAAVLAIACIAATGPGETWTADVARSTATFSTGHLFVSTVTGTIPIKSAELTIPAGSAMPTAVKATLDPAGVDTHDAARDADLRSARFLDVATYPTMTFESTSVTRIDASRFTITGNLTLHGITRPVTLSARYVGESGAGSALRLSYEANATIDRTQWGMTGGAPVVGTSIAIDLKVDVTHG